MTPLVPFIQEAVQFALSGSNVACQFYLSENLWSCNIDKNQIAQVIDNIVINAQQAMPNGGAIEVTAKNVSLGEDGKPIPGQRQLCESFNQGLWDWHSKGHHASHF